MSSKATYFRVGLFVLGGAVLLVGGVLLFGASQLFEKKVHAETYIDESVVGLEVGSPVKYRGVQVGAVKGITFVSRRYPEMSGDAHAQGRYILVDIAFEHDTMGDVSATDLDRRVADGLRIRLASSGITGVAYLEIDYLDKNDPSNAPPALEFSPRSYYIPSAPSTIARFTNALDRIIEQIERTKIDEVGNQLRELLATLEKTIDEDFRPILSNIEASTREFPETMKAARGAVEKLEGIVSDAAASYDRDVGPTLTSLRAATDELEPFARSLNEAVAEVKPTLEEIRSGAKEIPETLAQAQRALRSVDRLAGSQRRDVDEILSNLRVATNDLKELTSTLKRYPAQALFGEPPPRREENR